MNNLAQKLTDSIAALDDEFIMDTYKIDEFYIKPRISNINDIGVTIQ